MIEKFSQSTGLEPARGDPIGFQVQRLNHSATTASDIPLAILTKQSILEKLSLLRGRYNILPI